MFILEHGDKLISLLSLPLKGMRGDHVIEDAFSLSFTMHSAVPGCAGFASMPEVTKTAKNAGHPFLCLEILCRGAGERQGTPWTEYRNTLTGVIFCPQILTFVIGWHSYSAMATLKPLLKLKKISSQKCTFFFFHHLDIWVSLCQMMYVQSFTVEGCFLIHLGGKYLCARPISEFNTLTCKPDFMSLWCTYTENVSVR